MDFKRYLKEYPNKEGRFGKFGGAYLPEELVPAFAEINEAYLTICHSSQFINELRRIRREFQGRPTPVYHCERLSRKIGNCQLYLNQNTYVFCLISSSEGIQTWLSNVHSHPPVLGW